MQIEHLDPAACHHRVRNRVVGIDVGLVPSHPIEIESPTVYSSGYGCDMDATVDAHEPYVEPYVELPSSGVSCIIGRAGTP